MTDDGRELNFPYQIREVEISSKKDLYSEVYYDKHGSVCVVTTQEDWEKIKKIIKNQSAIKR